MLYFSLIMTTLLSLTMIGFGFLFIKRPPEEINSVFGYRTRMSTQNKDTWDFAHRYSGKIWLICGIITEIISVVVVFSLQNLKNYNQIMLIMFYIQLAALLLVIPLTEAALRKTFTKNGIRKQS